MEVANEIIVTTVQISYTKPESKAWKLWSCIRISCSESCKIKPRNETVYKISKFIQIAIFR